MIKGFLTRLTLPIWIFLGGSITLFFILFGLERINVYEDIDSKLLNASRSVKYRLGEGYINNHISQKGHSSQELSKLSTTLDNLAREYEVDGLYLIFANKSSLALSTANKRRNQNMEIVTKPLFINTKGSLGRIRSVYSLENSGNSRPYIVRADMDMSHINTYIVRHMFKLGSSFLIFLLFSMPLLISFIRLIATKKGYEERVEEISSKDPVSGAYNRAFGLELLSSFIDRKNTCIFIVDIENLHKISFFSGLKNSEEATKYLVDLLKSSFRSSDIIVRLRGDKFMVGLKSCPPITRGLLIERFRKKLNDHNLKSDVFLQLNYLLKPYKGEFIEEFIDEAINELITTKEYDTKEEAKMVLEMFKALKKKEFIVYYQPKVDLRNRSISYEALIRWLHPTKGLISPGVFIPVAEKSLIIDKLTLFVLDEALRVSKELDSDISINMSPIAFENDDFLSEIRKTLENDPNSNRITFEITEGLAIKNFDRTLEEINRLKKTGIKFSIDDFGVGYSSLCYLEKLPVNEVKIDRSFVSNLGNQKINTLIVVFVCQAAKVLGLNVVTEGTEEIDQIKHLMKLGCGTFQGFFFDKPQPVEVIKERLPEYHNKINCFN